MTDWFREDKEALIGAVKRIADALEKGSAPPPPTADNTSLQTRTQYPLLRTALKRLDNVRHEVELVSCICGRCVACRVKWALKEQL